MLPTIRPLSSVFAKTNFDFLKKEFMYQRKGSEMKLLLSATRKTLKIVIALALIAWLPAPGLIAQQRKVKNIVIVHGEFADGSGWQQVFKILTRRGYHVTIVQNPLTSFEDDV